MKRISRTLILFCLILALLPLSVQAAETYVTAQEAAAILKEAQLNRQTPVTVYVQGEAGTANVLFGTLLEGTYAHTGVPTEGDYLRWHIYSTGVGGTYYTENGSDYLELTYEFGYCDTAAQEAEMQAKYNQVLAALKLEGKSEYEKVKAIYDYITASVRYDYDNLPLIQSYTYTLPLSAYAALMKGTAVCQGYSNLFYRLALDAGLDCRIITGIGNGGDHAWNIVRIGGVYYNLDATWDEGAQEYRFFLKGSKDFPDHQSDAEFLTASFTAQYPISETNYDPGKPGCAHKDVTLVNGAEASCTQEGYSGDWQCKACGAIVTSGIPIAATGHTEVVDFAKAATCTETGLTAGKHCSVCQVVILAQEVIPVTDHKAVLKNEKVPTCKEEGYTGDTVCTDCGVTLETGTAIPAAGHSWDEGVVVRDPSCDQTGQLTYTCLVCGNMSIEQLPTLCGSFAEVFKADSVLKQGFTVTNPKTGANAPFSYTTPDKGVTMLVFFSHLCSNSQYLMERLDSCTWLSNPYLNVVAVESKATGASAVMDFINTYTPNSAPLIDYYYAGSTNLAFAYYRLFSNKNSLTWPVVLMISDDGTVCYATDAVRDLTDVYNTLLCTSTAFAAYEAGEEPTEPCLHEKTSIGNAVQATCTADGYTGDTVCDSCGEVVATGTAIPATGHKWDDGTVTKEPAVGVEGIKTFTCTNGCGETKTEAIPALEPAPCSHEKTSTIKAAEATCTADGYTGDTVCDSCIEVVATGTAIPATGHKWDEGTVTKEPAVGVEGIKTFTCTNGCGETKTESIPALEPTPCSHEKTSTIKAAEATCTADGYTGDTVCDSCGEVVATGTAIPATGHKWDDGTVTKEPAVGVEGIKTFTCTNGCGETKTEAIPALAPSTSDIDRIAGNNRFGTAFAVANAMKQKLGVDKFDSVIVASGTNFADALSGSYLASVKNAPILLSYTTDSVNSSVKEYIRANLVSGGTVYILGGTSAVPASMETGLEGFVIKRLAGNDRFGTNLEILKEAGIGDKDVLICTGGGFADSLSASAAKLPILLVWKELSQEQIAFLQTTAGKLYVIGGTSAVSDALMAQVSSFGPTTRLGGTDRFQTSVLIAQTLLPNATQAVYAYAWDFPDGLCGGPLASVMDAPLILTMTKYEKTAADYAASQGITQGVALGGTKLISDDSLLLLAGK